MENRKTVSFPSTVCQRYGVCTGSKIKVVPAHSVDPIGAISCIREGSLIYAHRRNHGWRDLTPYLSGVDCLYLYFLFMLVVAEVDHADLLPILRYGN